MSETSTTAQDNPNAAGDQSGTEGNPTQQTQQAPTGDQQTGGAEGNPEGSTQTGAPESYADFTMPEGMEVDKAALEQFLPVARELNLTQEQAQKLIDIRSQQVEKQARAQQDSWNNTLTGWVDQGKKDAEFGGDNYDANVAIAQRALEKIGTPELREALNMSGMGNHPEVIRAFVRVGKLLETDSPVTPQGDGHKKTAAEVLYGDQGKAA